MGGEIPDSDREVIDKILDLDEAVNHYNPITFDKTKYYYRNSETTEELIDYFIIWARQGADDPLCYLSPSRIFNTRGFIPVRLWTTTTSITKH